MLIYGMPTKKQLLIKHRNQKIKAAWDSLPEGAWTLQELADMFKCSVSTVWYAIYGRNHKK
jgi:hypothetical protein